MKYPRLTSNDLLHAMGASGSISPTRYQQRPRPEQIYRVQANNQSGVGATNFSQTGGGTIGKVNVPLKGGQGYGASASGSKNSGGGGGGVTAPYFTDSKGKKLTREQVLSREGLTGTATTRAEAERQQKILMSLPSKYSYHK